MSFGITDDKRVCNDSSLHLQSHKIEIFNAFQFKFQSFPHTKQIFYLRTLGIQCTSRMDHFYVTSFSLFHYFSFVFLRKWKMTASKWQF